MSRTVLSLCDFSGAWSDPYARAGFTVYRVDLQHPPGETKLTDNVWTIGCDVGKFDVCHQPDIVLAAPPCTCFCRPGARWWKRQDASGDTARDVMSAARGKLADELADAVSAVELYRQKAVALEAQLGQQIQDSCADDTAIRAACAKVLPHEDVYGDGYMPAIVDLVEAVVARIAD